ncbi:MAG: ABC transporter ATP-binding protein [Aigarchaeota archaeon]|jgi:NitT/TauT family transport system ATP-binding protein|nr:ABC transporter ATP-binding protein [Candidatus Caldarchaeales archaeon]
MIQIENLVKSYSQTNNASEFKVIDGLSLSIDRGQKVGIVGQTGCGKSTFLRIVLGIEKPTAGRVLINGREPYIDYGFFKGKISAVFQEDRLLPWRTALDNVLIGLEIMNSDKKKAVEEALHWLEMLGLSGFVQAYPSELSGGMRQRVAIARALIINPEVVLLDEAFGHLDEVTSRRLRSDFFKILEGRKTTVVMVTHNLDEALESVERIIVFGKPAKVLGDFKTSDFNPIELRRILQEVIEKNVPYDALVA